MLKGDTNAAVKLFLKDRINFYRTRMDESKKEVLILVIKQCDYRFVINYLVAKQCDCVTKTLKCDEVRTFKMSDS